MVDHSGDRPTGRVGLDHAGRRWLALTAALLMLLGIVGLAVPEIIRRAVRAAELGDVGAIVPLAGVGVAIALLTAGLDYGSRIASTVTQNRLERRLQAQVLDKTLRLARARVTERGDGLVLTHIMDDAPSFAKGHVAAWGALYLGLVSVVGGVVYCVLLNPVIAGLTIAFNVAFRLCTRMVDRKITAISAALRRVREHTNALLADLVGAKDVIQVFRREGWAAERLADSQDQERVGRNRSFAWTLGYADSQWMVKKLAEVLIVFGVGGWLAMRGTVEVSVLIAFVAASNYFYDGFSALLQFGITRAQVAPAKQVLTEYLSQAEDSHHSWAGADGTIAFDRVGFGYGGRSVLRDVSFRINPGDWVEIRGPNGAGKSTLVALMLGLLHPDSGVVSYQATGSPGRSGADAQSAAVYIPQATTAFAGDAVDNIALGDPDARRAAAAAVSELALTECAGGDASSYSTGELHRVGIARALVRLTKARYLIGDEITAGLDRENRDRVLAALVERARGRTVVIISHEPLDLPFDLQLTVADGRVTRSDVGATA